ncbi:response regulator transcription factor [Oxalobacter vibrioformis]|uniref:Response regulator transcription factor n=1 Tax=Oxalobacter vibrioformis TaxID=933080 RepID=A0A9E9P3J6_9BURK|nr:response regulator transcription factor [Oxalobacter vibrioformis]WAW10093.1 response regulator transcription factor [Oxalobacter vibrioformis]
MHVLLIDDDHDLYSLLNEYLGQEGITCTHAPDAEKAFLEVNHKRYDILILDVMLPGMNGFEILRRLRSDERNLNLPVIMLTARGREVDKVIGLEMGADDYLGKPFNPRELVARLRALFRRANPSILPYTQQVHDVGISRAAHSITINGKTQQLSMPEMQLLNLLTENVGQPVPRGLLYMSIYGYTPYSHDRSLDMLVSRLRKKLGQRPDGGKEYGPSKG